MKSNGELAGPGNVRTPARRVFFWAVPFGAAVLGALLHSTVVSGQDRSYRLQLSDRVGQTSRYRLAFDIQMRADYSSRGKVNPQTRELMEMLAAGMSVRTAVEYEQALVAVARDGTREFEIRWHDFDYVGEIGGKPIVPPPAYQRSRRDLLSRTARVRTTAAGRTLSVAYADSIGDRLERAPDQLESPIPIHLPEGPVAVGDRWRGTARFPASLSPVGADYMTLELDHRLKEVRQGATGPIAIIELQGNYSKLQGIEETGLDGAIHMEASLQGTALFDIRGGRFVGGDYEIDMFALRMEEGIELHLTGHGSGNLRLLRPR